MKRIYNPNKSRYKGIVSSATLKRKFILNLLIFTICIIGIGYANLYTNLNIDGEINVKKASCQVGNKLYNVLKCETENSGLAREYTGSHQDSMNASNSTEKIYHWYAANDTEGTQILDKNNVIFANHCWQIVRTTDTGGVKMIYNGEAVNNQCLNTRGNHIGYAQRTSQNLASSYWYGTKYTYDSSTSQFSISGTTEQATWNATTGPNLIGKYTCKGTTEAATCSTLYLVESYYNASNAYVIPLNSSSNYSQFGILQFNANTNSPTYVGYMYGDVYPYSQTNGTSIQLFTSAETLLSSTSLSTTYWYADSIDYGNLAAGKYSLISPYQVADASDYPNLVGKYTFRNTSQTYTTTSVYYIAYVDNTTMYYKQLSYGNLISDYNPIIFGDSITDNGDGTYTINNPVSVSLTDWYTDFSNYVNKYTCNSNTSTCASPRFTTATTKTYYTYMDLGSKILISKTRSGLTLTDTLLVRKDEWYNNYSNYSDYKYTCNSDASTCTESTLRMITNFGRTSYTYVNPNVKYLGSSVSWDGTNYTLVNDIDNFNSLNDISTHHYACISNGLKTCSSVAYIYYYTGNEAKYYYIILRDGIETVSKALEDMFTKNTTNSTMKSGIDAWYKEYLLDDYDTYIEDIIYCSDRSIRVLNGWKDDGGITTGYLQFKEYYVTRDLSCTNVTDRFSVANTSAQLTYKVGLMTSPEMNILNNNNTRNTGLYYWLASPTAFENGVVARSFYVDTSGKIDSFNEDRIYGARPAVSLTPGIEFTGGDGSMASPYIINTGV